MPDPHADVTISSTRQQVGALVADVLRQCGGRFVAVAVLSTAAAAAEGTGLLLLLPLLNLLGITSANGTSAFHGLEGMLGLGEALTLYVLIVAAAAAIVWGRTVAGGALTLDYLECLRKRLHGAVMGMDWRSVSTGRQADLTHALTAEVGRCGFAVDMLLRSLAATLQLPALLVAAAIVSPSFTAIALTLAAVVAFAVRPLNRRAHALGIAVGEGLRAMHAEVADQMAGLRILKVLSAEQRRGEVFLAMARGLRDQQFAMKQASATAQGSFRVAAAGTAALALYAGVRGLGVALADMLVLMTLFARLAMVAMQLQEGWRNILQQLPIHAHLMASLEKWRAAAEPAAVGPAPRLARAIRLEGVGYRHPAADGGEAGHALRRIEAVIPAFATTALTGPSGAGKSTLADLVMGLLPPAEGRILVDDLPLEGPLRPAWRSRIGYVPQDPFLFHDTIRANLALAMPAADEAELWRALDLAAAGFVRALPRGLDTVVGDRGSRLSGGERQRIALARALLGQPELLVLDEATSALDGESERRVLDALAGLRGRLTILIVAHRPSTIAAADTVLRLEAGRLVREGAARHLIDSSA